MSSTKTIALVEWNWSGHHPTYFNHFILALEELGFDVLAICPNPLEAESTAKKTRNHAKERVARRGCTHFRKFEAVSRRFYYFRPARISAIDWAIRHFKGIERNVRGWMLERGRKIDAVYYACIYDYEFEWIAYADAFLQMPWYGLYLHAQSYRMPGKPLPGSNRLPCPEKMFRRKSCKGVNILDEGIVAKVSASIGKPVVMLPEVADERPATNANDKNLGDQLKKFAAGRPIVGLFGHLLKSKGLASFLKAARLPAASDICFALGGEIAWYSFQAQETHELQIDLEESLNVWSHLARIREPALNHLMATCDIIFAAYLDFPHSSAIQCKAALLNKPVIVSDGYLMAERSRRFRLGEVIPQGNATAALEAIKNITSNPVGWVADKRPLWNDYRAENSFERFKSALGELLATV